jgi:hypothetical protein
MRFIESINHFDSQVESFNRRSSVAISPGMEEPAVRGGPEVRKWKLCGQSLRGIGWSVWSSSKSLGDHSEVLASSSSSRWWQGIGDLPRWPRNLRERGIARGASENREPDLDEEADGTVSFRIRLSLRIQACCLSLNDKSGRSLNCESDTLETSWCK